MTAVVSALAYDAQFMVADRLVSYIDPRGVPQRPFDADFNKLIVYWTNRDLLMLGFSGTAYVAGLPTDEFIVSSLLGRGDLGFLASTGARLPYVSAYEALASLADTLGRQGEDVRVESRGVVYGRVRA